MKLFAKFSLPIFFLMAIGGCATPYQSTSFMGGFSETRLGPDTFKISFRGNAFIGRETVANYTLLRSAEVALQNGYSYFIIIDESEYTKTGVYTTPTTAFTTSSGSYSGSSYSGSATTTFQGGDSFFYRKPGATNTIICFTEKPNVKGLVYDARYLSNSLKGKYGLSN